MVEASKVVGLLEESVLSEPGSLKVEMAFEDVEGWDSSSMVFFIAEVAGRYGAELAAGDVGACRTIGDLVRHVQQKAG